MTTLRKEGDHLTQAFTLIGLMAYAMSHNVDDKKPSYPLQGYSIQGAKIVRQSQTRQ
jgi:hypothetical protein